MKTKHLLARSLLLLALATCHLQRTTARADEGMWLFNQPPRQLLRERYQFDATDAWLQHLQKFVTGTNNVIIKNSAIGNGNDYSITSGNIVGPLITVTGIITNSNPWANFSF